MMICLCVNSGLNLKIALTNPGAETFEPPKPLCNPNGVLSISVILQIQIRPVDKQPL